jgi:DUF1365 family protein
MRSRLYRGWVEHHRRAPHEHRFRYRLGLLGLDLTELPTALARHPWFGHRRPALVRFHRGDYFGDPALPLDEAVRRHVATSCGIELDGPIELITTLRSGGYAFNPVSFYLCRDAQHELRCILAEITNTPWRERCIYVLPECERSATGSAWRFSFDKRFHISPFMPLTQRYEWTFRVEASGLMVHMRVLEADRLRFTASMRLRARRWSRANLSRHLLSSPLAPLQIVGRIYLQALRLWWKGAPVFPHPAAASPATPPQHEQSVIGISRSLST